MHPDEFRQVLEATGAGAPPVDDVLLAVYAVMKAIESLPSHVAVTALYLSLAYGQRTVAHVYETRGGDPDILPQLDTIADDMLTHSHEIIQNKEDQP